MKIQTKQHKLLIFQLFMEEKTNQMGQTEIVPRNFPLEQLADAGSAKNKVMSKVDGNVVQFEDGEVVFNPSEVVIVKKLFDEKKQWSVNDAEQVMLLKDIIYPKA